MADWEVLRKVYPPVRRTEAGYKLLISYYSTEIAARTVQPGRNVISQKIEKL